VSKAFCPARHPSRGGQCGRALATGYKAAGAFTPATQAGQLRDALSRPSGTENEARAFGSGPKWGANTFTG
jgi:hypothetical protein